MPRRRGAASALAAALLLFSFLFLRAEAASVAEADAAFEAGDHPRALALYDQVLDSDPDNVSALLRSAQLLSWTKRYDEAVRRYDRAIALAPDDREARIERAKVLSWDRRYGEAEAAFRALLERDPRDREARIGLARTLSWNGRQEPARAEYEKVLAAHPGDPEALVGVAQTYAWSGDSTRARHFYGMALESRPGMKEAVLGLAYVDLSSGDPEAAEARADDLARRFPGDADVDALVREVRRTSAPWLEASYDRLDDTDDNVLDTYRLEGGFGLPAGLGLRLGATRYDMRQRSSSAAVDSLYGVLSWTRRSNRIEARAGADRLDPPTGESTTHGIGGLAWTWGVGRRWQGSLSAQQDTYRYNPEILGHRIRTRAYATDVAGRVAGGFRVGAAAGAWDLSDGNDRRSLEAGGWHAWRIGAHTLEAGYQFRYLDYRQNLAHGYFDPSNFTAHLAQGRAAGPIGGSRARFDVRVETGIQSFTREDDVTSLAAEVSNDRVLGLMGSVSVPLGRAATLDLYAARSDYAVTSAAGFRSRQLGARVRWVLGRK